MKYFSHLFASEILLELMLVFGKHKLGILQDIVHILLFIHCYLAASLHLLHKFLALLNLLLDLVPLHRILHVLNDVHGGLGEILIEIKGENRVRIREVVACRFEGLVFVQGLH